MLCSFSTDCACLLHSSGVTGMSKFTEINGTLDLKIIDSVDRAHREIRQMTDRAMQELYGKIAWENRSIGQKRRFENQRKFTRGQSCR